MSLVEGSIKHPTSVIVGIILVTVFGYLSLRSLPVQLRPTLDPPIITVETEYRGAAPQEVEEQVTKPLEEKLNTVEHLEKITSTSSEGLSVVTLEFEWGVNKDLASIDILKKMNLVDLPEEAETPIISATTSDEERAVMYFVGQGADVNDIYTLADEVIKPRLERVSGVARVRFFGGQEREVQVIVDEQALKARAISLGQVRSAIRDENQNVKGGHIDEGGRRYVVRTVGQFASLDDIRGMIITRDGAGPVYMRDVARVREGYKDAQWVAKLNGEPTIIFAVHKKVGTNTLRVVDGVRAEMDRLRQELRPTGVSLQVVHTDSDYIWDAINMVVEGLEIGAVLAVVVLVFFLRSATSTVIVAFAIPISLVTTFILMKALGFTINVLSLAGLAFASGMLVDDAIVVVENIYRHMQKGKSRLQAAVVGTKEVALPVLASTLTTMVVFLPIVFIKEETGQLFRDMAAAIAFSVGISYVVAVTVSPMMCSRLLRAGLLQDASSRRRERILGVILLAWLGALVRRAFLGYVGWMVRGRARKVGVVAVILLGFYGSLQLLPSKEYLPLGNSNFIAVPVKLPPGTSLSKAEHIVDGIQKRFRKIPEISHVFAITRQSNPFVGVKAKPEHTSQAEMEKLVNGMRASLGDLAGAQAFVFRFPLFSRRGADLIQVEVRGDDLGKVQQYAAQVEAGAKKVAGVQYTTSSLELGNPELQVRIDREKAAALNLTVLEVADVIDTYVAGRMASLYRVGGEEVDITVKGSEQSLDSSESLNTVLISLPNGAQVPLTHVASVQLTSGPSKIDHIELDRSITLDIRTSGQRPLEEVIGDIRTGVVAQIERSLPPGYLIEMAGAADSLDLAYQALLGAFVLAVLIVYLLMAALFESFFYPFIILFTIPLAISGGILGIHVSQAPFDMLTLLGFIILAGVVVKNAIILIDFANQLKRQGMDRNEALAEACRVRLRPIFMTAATSVFGMLPLALGKGAGSELYRGLAATMVGGLAVSTVFSLIFVPTLYSIFDDIGVAALQWARRPKVPVPTERLAK